MKDLQSPLVSTPIFKMTCVAYAISKICVHFCSFMRLYSESLCLFSCINVEMFLVIFKLEKLCFQVQKYLVFVYCYFLKILKVNWLWFRACSRQKCQNVNTVDNSFTHSIFFVVNMFVVVLILFFLFLFETYLLRLSKTLLKSTF